MKKLAFNYSVNLPNIDLTLSSVSNIDILNENMKFYEEGLNEDELKILMLIREK
jgi:hypothetical protein